MSFRKFCCLRLNIASARYFCLQRQKLPLNTTNTNFLFTMNETPGMRHRRPQVIRFVSWQNDIKLWRFASLRASPGSSLAKQQGSSARPSRLRTLLVLSHLVPRLSSCLQFPTVICTPTIWHLLGKQGQYFCKDLRVHTFTSDSSY